MTDDLAYVFVLDTGYETRAEMLLKSIEEAVEDPEIYVFIEDVKRLELPEKLIEQIETRHSLIEGEIPNPDYRMSLAHAALYEASEKSSAEYLALLDTDTLVMEEITIHKESDADLLLKPVDIGGGYWGSNDSIGEWKKFFQKYDIDPPNSKSVSTVDKEECWPPYYNGGVIITRNNDFPERWLKISNEIHGNIRNTRFAEQIGLALLAADYQVEELNEEYNYPLIFRLRLDEDTKIVHYHAAYCLFRGLLFNPKAIRKISIDYLKAGSEGRKLELAIKTPYNILVTLKDSPIPLREQIFAQSFKRKGPK